MRSFKLRLKILLHKVRLASDFFLVAAARAYFCLATKEAKMPERAIAGSRLRNQSAHVSRGSLFLKLIFALSLSLAAPKTGASLL